ncbi:phenol degradation protein meta [Paraburkholderia ginsengiterrae]|uniref:Phenol degradation protein meta n=1 Tax=Paraburkholderia ginsengiterrae TaxID=1462993 RepID=A0A1A9N8M6_9BURK|nr:phenol degradation protein meta [Paraburkholderia ginsengiterrae]OAJ61555.1 phenol degradation protein meta [Paraburkholderia ginsengiterrae]
MSFFEFRGYCRSVGIPLRVGAAIASCCWITTLHATEGDGSNYPIGVNTLLSGVQPPPGNHIYVYLQEYEATTLVGNSGNPSGSVSEFSLHAQAAAFRLSHVWRDVTFLGATLESRTNIPFVNLDLHFDAHTPKGTVYKSGSATGLSDLTVGPLFLGWHWGNLHQVVGLEFFLPTGSYDASRLVNPGRHYYSMQPNYAVTWMPVPNVEFSARALYSVNSVNHVTDYHSGNEFIVDYNAGFRVTPMWQIGASGYFYRQVTDDTQHGQSVNGNGNRGQVFAVGPSIAYGTRKFSVALKYQRETMVRNRPEGNRVWLQMYMPFE